MGYTLAISATLLSISEGKIGYGYYPDYPNAALSNWGHKYCDIRSSCYGPAYTDLTLGDLIDFVESKKSNVYLL